MNGEQRGAISRARETFLSTGRLTTDVRPTTARSWLRSRAFGVDPDAPLNLPWTGEVDGETALLRAASPIAEKLFEDMQGIGAAMFLTDSGARIVGRWSGDAGLVADLDAVGSRVGAVIEESNAGTTALGTVLEEGQAVEVMGCEHFCASLLHLAAVGVPVVHPVSRRIEGVVDLVCPDRLHSPMMLPLVKRAAHEIGARLLTGYAGQDRHLLDAFLNAERRGPRRPMLAINSRVLMANPPAADLLGETTHAMLWNRLQRALRDGDSQCVLATDEDGVALRGLISETRNAGELVGAIVQLGRRDEVADQSVGRASAVPRYVTLLRDRLPGGSARWQSVLQRSSAVISARERLLLVGESGVGKRALALTLCDVHGLGPPTEHDAVAIGEGGEDAWFWEITTPVADRAGVRLLSHLDRLDASALDRLTRVLDVEDGEGGPIIATYRCSDGIPVPAELLAQFPHVVELPSLADRPEDVTEIAAAVAVMAARHDPVRIEPPALRLLAGSEWPGNTRQLRRTVLAARAVCPGSVIRTEDLPDQFRSTPSWLKLTRMQSRERDLIAATLAAEGGNKVAAAQSLGISRSTLYRKLKAFRLDE